MKMRFASVLLFAMVSVLFAYSNGKKDSAPPKASNEAQVAKDAAWPVKPITIIVPASAGGGTDLNARFVAKYLTKELGQPVVITNIKGSSGALGLQEARKAQADGYTLAFFTEDIVTNQLFGISDFGYKDFSLVCNCLQMDMFLVSNDTIPNISTLKKYASDHPGKVVYGGETSGFVSLLPFIIQEKLNVTLKIVDGGQMAERLPLMVGKQIDLTFGPYSMFKDYVETGKLFVSLVGDKRSELFPSIPTCKEQGLDIVINRTQYLLAPKGTPQAVIDKIAAAVEKLSRDSAYIKDAAVLTARPAYSNSAGVVKALEDYDKLLNENIKYVKKSK